MHRVNALTLTSKMQNARMVLLFRMPHWCSRELETTEYSFPIVAIFIFHTAVVGRRTLDGGGHGLQAAFQFCDAKILVNMTLGIRFPRAARSRVDHVLSKLVQTA